MFCLLFGILFFPFILPFLIIRFVFKLLFALLMVPFVLFVVAGALFMALAGVVLARVLAAASRSRSSRS